MTKNENIHAFRTLLQKGIGERSQAEFAKEAGISAEHLNRLLNSDKASRPNRTTLKKIALHLIGNVTYDDLCAVCGYDPDDGTDQSQTESMRRKSMSPTDRAFATTEDIRTGFDAISGWRKFWPSLDDALEVFIMLYSGEPSLAFSIGKPLALNDLENDAEFAVPVRFYWTDEECSISITIALHYLETKIGRCSICGYSFSSADVSRASGNNSETCASFIPSEYVIEIVDKRNMVEKRKPDKQLLASIPTNEYYYNTVCGFGLQFRDIPETVRAFVIAHEESFHEGSDEDYVIEMIKDANASDETIAQLYKHLPGRNVYLHIISNIMRRETGIPFCYCDNRNRLPGVFDNIIVLDHDIVADQKTIREITKKYAKELELEEYGWYYHTTRFDKKNNETYRV